MLQYGKCVLIVRQTYIYTILIFIFAFGFYYNITHMFDTKGSNFHEHQLYNAHKFDENIKQHYLSSDLSWEGLIKDCGSKVMIENSARANEIFNRKYLRKVVEWKGYFMSAYVQALHPMQFNPEHMLNLNIRMIPSESINNPDLFLALDAHRYKSYAHVIRNFHTGTPIKFRAEFEAIGNEWRPHHLHLIHIEKTEDFIDHDHKVVLFQGINFNIQGHLKLEKEIKQLQLGDNTNVVNVNTNNTISNTTNTE
jgi:hypothetical protein